MKISKITIKQLFGIKEWQGDGKNIELVGDNGTGKTSVIDAIRYALTNSSDREFIVKNGETEGEIYIETDNGLSIDRKARTAMTDYKSVKQNGNVIPSPESFLKTIFTPLQLSPMGCSEKIGMERKVRSGRKRRTVFVESLLRRLPWKLIELYQLQTEKAIRELRADTLSE